MNISRKLGIKPKKPKSVSELMNQGAAPSITMPQESVQGLMKQGKAPKFPDQGTRSVKSLMNQ